MNKYQKATCAEFCLQVYTGKLMDLKLGVGKEHATWLCLYMQYLLLTSG